MTLKQLNKNEALTLADSLEHCASIDPNALIATARILRDLYVEPSENQKMITVWRKRAELAENQRDILLKTIHRIAILNSGDLSHFKLIEQISLVIQESAKQMRASVKENSNGNV